MKVSEISILIIPNPKEEEQGYTKKLLVRTADKLWHIENEVGLHPMFIDLAKKIQDAISTWNSQS